jgi:hypothetical protein
MTTTTRARLYCTTILFLALLTTSLPALERTASVQFGYGDRLDFLLNTTISDFAQGFPLDVRFGFAYSSVDPGDPAAARKIFINDGTNGTPQEDGNTWDLRCDLVWDFNYFEKHETFLFAGPRYSQFTGSFKYVGGNEQFDVTGTQWGVGGGIESRYQLLESKRTELVLTAMLDYYLDDTLAGHDTAYSPGGSDINPRWNYTWGDADSAIDQPKFVPRLMVGISRRLGK